MADTDVANMKENEPKDLPEAEKPLAEAQGETVVEEPASENAATEEE